MMDLCEVRGVVHGSKETSGEFPLREIGTVVHEASFPPKGPVDGWLIALTAFPEQGERADSSNRSNLGGLARSPVGCS